MARKSRGAVQAEQAKAPALAAPAPAPVQYSGEMITITRNDRQYRIPVEIYEGQDPDMTTDQVVALTDAAEADKGDGRVALDGVGMLLTAFDQLRAELGAERTARRELEQLVLAMAKEREAEELEIESARSQELDQQLAEIGTAIANAGAVRADLDGSAERLKVERANTEQWFASETAALQQPVAALQGTVKSSTVLMGERSAAIEDQLAAGESRQQRLDVQLQELGGQVEVIGNPPSRAEIRDMVTSIVTGEVSAQAPTLVNQAIDTIREDEFPGGSVFGQRVDGDLTRRRREAANRFNDKARGGIS